MCMCVCSIILTLNSVLFGIKKCYRFSSTTQYRCDYWPYAWGYTHQQLNVDVIIGPLPGVILLPCTIKAAMVTRFQDMFIIRVFIPVNNVEGGYRNSQRPYVRPKRKSSHSHNFPTIITKFLQHVYITEKYYTGNMQFHKKWQKVPMFALYMKA